MDKLDFNTVFNSLANHSVSVEVLDADLKSTNVFFLFLEKIACFFTCSDFDKTPYNKSIVRDNLNNLFSQNIDKLKDQDPETLRKVRGVIEKLQKSFAKGTETVDINNEQVTRPMGADSLQEALDVIDETLAPARAASTDVSEVDSEELDKPNPYSFDPYAGHPQKAKIDIIRTYVGKNDLLIQLYLGSPEEFKRRYGVDLG